MKAGYELLRKMNFWKVQVDKTLEGKVLPFGVDPQGNKLVRIEKANGEIIGTSHSSVVNQILDTHIGLMAFIEHTGEAKSEKTGRRFFTFDVGIEPAETQTNLAVKKED